MPPSQTKATAPPLGKDDGLAKNSQACRLFDTLPPEALLRILQCLPHESAIICERVCHEWRAVARMLPEWHSWLLRMARITETALSLPCAVPPAFGAAPATVTPEQSAAAAAARLRARRLPPHETCLAACGASWTVLAVPTAADVRSGTHELVPVAQFSAHDFLLSACPSAGRVYSGDKDGQLRVWGAHSGDLLARIPVAGAITSLEAAGARSLFSVASQPHGAAPPRPLQSLGRPPPSAPCLDPRRWQVAPRRLSGPSAHGGMREPHGWRATRGKVAGA